MSENKNMAYWGELAVRAIRDPAALTELYEYYFPRVYQYLLGKTKDSSLADEALRYLLGAEREYIESWFRGLEDMYGSFGRYAAEGLLLSDDDILRLREMYLE